MAMVIADASNCCRVRTDGREVFSEAEYQLEEHLTYAPDVSSLSKERAAAMDPERLAQGAPDLAVEVVSSESAEYLEEKVEDYFAHGCRIVGSVPGPTGDAIARFSGRLAST
jgi:Uma2 family endonuclease